ncbi:MAG TPA: Fe-S cluster domain-containing protein [Candidatus Saccharimonadales bacterium]|nr:Fe-S cluster domain-containing protein [Candidatus Saccharimonadales bacterium]
MEPTVWTIALWGLAVFAVLGLMFGLALAVAAIRFAVKTNPLVERVREVLPSANCGACGFAGCPAYAEAVVERRDVPPNLCAPGRGAVAHAVAALTGKEVGQVLDRIVVMRCAGTSAYARNEAEYAGIETCAAASLVFGGPKACKNGCLGLGDCVRACPFGALQLGAGGIAEVLTDRCTGCGICVPVCPKNLFELYPRNRRVELSCAARDKQVVVRATCMVGCIQCRKCVAKCPAGAITWDGSTIAIDHDKCIAYGPSCNEACVDVCPSVILHRVGQAPRPQPARAPVTLEV